MSQENHLMLELFEKTADLVFVVNKEGWIFRANPAVLSTLGYSHEELTSKPVSEFIHPEDRAATAAFVPVYC